ncbi:sterol desaturase, partial [Pseudomonas sp. BJa5]|nr:sterol desaturase [Pseudomonas sp. BGr12]
MDALSLVHQYQTEWVITPVTEQFLGNFNVNGRYGVLFLCISYGVAYALFPIRKQRGLSDAHSFWQYVGGSRVHLHPS